MKKTISLLATGALLFTGIGSAFANETSTEVVTVPSVDVVATDDANRISKLCTSGEFGTKLNERITMREQQLQKRRDTVDQNIERRRALKDSAMAQADAKAEEKLAGQEDKLAIHEQFSTSVNSAVSQHRSATNANIKTFRSAIDEVNSKSKTALNAAVTTLQSEACANPNDKTSVKAAWDKFKTTVKDLRASNKTEKAALRSALRKNNQTALSSLKSALETARQTRRDAYKNLRPTAAPTVNSTNTNN